MAKIGILGGTFNPIHNEHINLIKSAIRELCLDKLIVVPSGNPPHKNVAFATPKQRLNMLKIGLENIDKVIISTFELDNDGVNYSYLTVEHFKSLYQKDSLFFIVGYDMLVDFKTWKYPSRILNSATLVVALRSGEIEQENEKFKFEKTFKTTYITLQFCGKAVSSTKVRAYASLG